MIMIASSYDNHWLVIINGLQIARVKTYEELVNSNLRHDQLKEWYKLTKKDKQFIKNELEARNKCL